MLFCKLQYLTHYPSTESLGSGFIVLYELRVTRAHRHPFWPLKSIKCLNVGAPAWHLELALEFT